MLAMKMMQALGVLMRRRQGRGSQSSRDLQLEAKSWFFSFKKELFNYCFSYSLFTYRGVSFDSLLKSVT